MFSCIDSAGSTRFRSKIKHNSWCISAQRETAARSGLFFGLSITLFLRASSMMSIEKARGSGGFSTC